MGNVQGDQGGHVSYLGLTGGLPGGKDQGKSSHGRQAMTVEVGPGNLFSAVDSTADEFCFELSCSHSSIDDLTSPEGVS